MEATCATFRTTRVCEGPIPPEPSAGPPSAALLDENMNPTINKFLFMEPQPVRAISEGFFLVALEASWDSVPSWL